MVFKPSDTQSRLRLSPGCGAPFRGPRRAHGAGVAHSGQSQGPHATLHGAPAIGSSGYRLPKTFHIFRAPNKPRFAACVSVIRSSHFASETLRFEAGRTLRP